MKSPQQSADGGGRTNDKFWDSQWEDRADRSLSYRLLHGGAFGKNGLFLRVMDRHVPENVLNGASVIELGGASSLYLVDLATHRGCDVTALDYSDVGIEQTKELFARKNVKGHAIYADMFEWRDGDNSFDVVTHWGVLEHFDDPAPTLSVSAKFAKPGGFVVFTMPNLAAAGARLWQHFAPKNFSAHVYHSDETVRACCEQAGLDLVAQFEFGPPLIRMAPPERGGVAAQVANGAHAVVCMAGSLAPVLFTRGHRRVSSQRAFVARKRGVLASSR